MDMTRIFDTSRIRWVLAGGVAVLALVAAVQALVTYRAYELTVGVLSVVALAVTLLVGLASLAVARRRIGVELTALQEPSTGPAASQPLGAVSADPTSPTASDPGPGSSPAPAPDSVPTMSTLLRARHERLLAIRAAGVRPDRQVLAEATAAEEAGRAYFGRYFVATTVLIGLVGTFAGLMATLSKVAPILHDQDAGGLALLAGPLSGLHVTFGASLVAILATLALALAQGDLALHEEQALAVLEDRTTHQLIPALWPPAEEPAERTVRAFAELKTILADAVAQSLEQSAARMSKTARSDAERAARALESTAAAVEKQITELGATVGQALQTVVTTVEKQLSATTSSVEKQLSATTSSVEKQLSATTEALEKQLTATAGALEKQLTQLGATVGGALETSSAAVEKHMTHLGTSLSAALEASGARVEKQVTQLSTTASSVLETTAAAVEQQLTRLSSSVGGALETATQKQTVAMAEAARKQAAAMAEVAEATTGRAIGAAEEAVRRSATLAEETVRATTAELGRTLQPMLAAESQRLELVREAFGQTVTSIQEATGRLAELQAVLEGNSRAHAAAIENAGQAVLAAFDRAVLGAGASLDGAAVKLAAAAHDLGGGVETFSPAIATLATELGALGRELALQTARGPEGDLGAVVLSELDRIGAGLDRLVQLSRLAGGGSAFPSPTAAELGAAPTAESRGPDTEETHS